MDNAAGMMFSAVTTGGLTVTFAEPVMDPEAAVMVTAPVVMATTLPAALTLAIAAVDELQVAAGAGLVAQVGQLLHGFLGGIRVVPKTLGAHAPVEFGYRALLAAVVKDAP